MYFEMLHTRLVAAIRYRVRNGEMSERGVARLAGISQPHMHNVLKGVRSLSSESADILLRSLRMDIFDLLEREETAVYWRRERDSMTSM